MDRIKIRLKVDLTKYHPELKIGAEGYTIGTYGIWSRGSNRFIGVCFPNIATLDVLWDSLEIIDSDYLKQLEKNKKEKEEALKSATNVVKHLGPKGGFRVLSYEYKQNGITVHASTGSKGEAESLEKLFEKNNINVIINK